MLFLALILLYLVSNYQNHIMIKKIIHYYIIVLAFIKNGITLSFILYFFNQIKFRYSILLSHQQFFLKFKLNIDYLLKINKSRKIASLMIDYKIDIFYK